MSLSEGDEGHIFNLLSMEEPYLYRPDLLDQEGKESPFRIVWQISRFASVPTSLLILAPLPIQAFAFLVSIA